MFCPGRINAYKQALWMIPVVSAGILLREHRWSKHEWKQSCIYIVSHVYSWSKNQRVKSILMTPKILVILLSQICNCAISTSISTKPVHLFDR